MSIQNKLFSSHEIAIEMLEDVGGAGFADKKYTYTNTKDYSNIGNTTTNVAVYQYGTENSATGAGAIGVKFG